jgi:two-component system cell cycle response regulator DivK
MPTTPQILIVDDNHDHRLILAHQLTKLGAFVIHEAPDGHQALTIVATQPPDLIFMNLGLPVLDGWETTRRIRTLPPPAGQVPIIAFTAYAWGTEEQRARAAGCNAYLTKPILDPHRLEQTVVGLLTAPQRP